MPTQYDPPEDRTLRVYDLRDREEVVPRRPARRGRGDATPPDEHAGARDAVAAVDLTERAELVER